MNDGTAIQGATLCLLLLLLTPVVPAFGQTEALDVDEVPAYAAWRENVRSLGNLRLTYATESRLGSNCKRVYGDMGRTKSVAPEDWPPVVHRILRVSRAGGFVVRDLTMERFETTTIKPVNASAEAATDNASTLESVRVHGDGVFYSYYPERHAGSVWPKWDRRPPYPISFVLPPDPEEYRLISMDTTGGVLDFAKGKSLVRYLLSPEASMMPVRIEYYKFVTREEQTTATLFLFDLITVTEYTKTQTGAFLPRKATYYKGAVYRKDGAMDVDRAESYRLTGYEEIAKFPPDEFHYAFPPGTRVTDNIKETEYTVGAEEPANE